jgi:hypothetical protein
MPTQSDILNLIEVELTKVREISRRENLRTVLVPLQMLSLKWEYGKPDERFECWLVGMSSDGQKRLLYCDCGFGPTYPWGIVSNDSDWLGMDSQWHEALEDAAIGAGLLPAPPDYEVP